MNETRTCPSCGAELARDSPAQLCPKCLLEAGLAPSTQDAALGREQPKPVDEVTMPLSGSPETAIGRGAKVRYFGDYELLEEIARGGMGVVYKARQTSLNRIVALKMILSGQLASDADVQRFRAEAQAAANLQHPNIVAIHEVGEHDGQHFFSMDYVNGQSLAELVRENPLAPQRAAELVDTIARAIQFAHEQGTLHRDLKPSNILIDPQGQPRITDFGLAKQTQTDSELTHTGQVLGTPSYMPPEQAAGKRSDVGPTSDVYSLGAILYELLTGRPPFRAETALDTIMQVLEDDPVSPRLLNSRVPKDLETICLKCLQKEPQGRYAGATELANDLRAFLDGRPILARPVSVPELAIRWLKRQQRSVALTAVVAVSTLLLVIASLVGWYAYSDWRLSFLSLETEQPPLAVEIMSDDGSLAGDLLTVPTQQPVKIPQGQYTLRVSAEHRLSQTYRVSLSRDAQEQYTIGLEDDLLADIQIPQTFLLVNANDDNHLMSRSQVLLIDERGLTLRDVSQGNGIWTIELDNATGFIWPPSKMLGAMPYSGHEKFSLRPFIATWDRGTSHPADPIQEGNAEDLNGDGQPDIVLACRHQALLMAIAGTSKEIHVDTHGSPEPVARILWIAARGSEFQTESAQEISLKRRRLGVRSSVIYPPQFLPDINGDDVPDVLAIFGDVGTDQKWHPVCWVEVLSGATGETVWRYGLPHDAFQLTDGEEVPYAFRWFVGQVGGYGQSGGGSYKSNFGRAVRSVNRNIERSGSHVYLPDAPWISVSASPAASANDPHDAGVQGAIPRNGTLVQLVVGRQLITLRASDGMALRTSDIGIRPRQPVTWTDLDGDRAVEALVVARPTSGSATALRLAAWSMEHQRLLWDRQIEVRVPQNGEVMHLRPTWPLAIDLDADGACEVVVPNGTPIGSSEPWGAVEVLDGPSGQPRWNRRLMTMDQCIEQFAVGPDGNGDGHREVYAATMWGEDRELFVDCLSGKDGKSLWWASRKLRKPGHAGNYLAGPLRWWNEGHDGWPQLLVPTYDGDSSSVAQLTLFSSGTGERTRVGAGLSYLHITDVDGDGLTDLSAFRSESRANSLHDGGRLTVIRAARERWRRLHHGSLHRGADYDGDGIRDLLETRHQLRGVRVISGANGGVLWESKTPLEYPTPGLPADVVSSMGQAATTAKENSVWDFDDDGVDDVLLHHERSMRGGLSPATALSGRTGKLLWELDTRVRVIAGTPLLDCQDLNGDGEGDIIAICALTFDDARDYSRTHLALSTWSSRTGRPIWLQPLSDFYEGEAAGRMPHDLKGLRLETPYADLNGDGVLDLLLPTERGALVTAINGGSSVGKTRSATVTSTDTEGLEMRAISGMDGKLLWRHPVPDVRDADHALNDIPPPAVADLDGDGNTEVILLLFEETQELRSRNERWAWVKALDAGTGQLEWEWRTTVEASCGEMRSRPSKDDQPRPRILSAGEQCNVALNLWGAGGRLVVLGHDGKPIWQQSGGEFTDPFRCWICDGDGDGSEEVILLRNGEMVAVGRDGPQKPLWNRPLAGVAEIQTIIAPHQGEPPTIVLQHENALVGTAANDGAIQWITPSIPGGSEQVFHLGSLIEKSSAAEPNTRENKRSSGELFCCAKRNAISARYVVHSPQQALEGSATVGDESPLAGIEPAPTIVRPKSIDPRLLRPLPWRLGAFGSWRESIWFGTWAGFYAISLLLLPLAFTLTLIRKRSFSLRQLFALPAVVGVFLLGANWEANRTMGEQLAPKLILGAAAFPVVLALCWTTYWLLTRRWTIFFRWLSVTIVVSVLMAGLLLTSGFNHLGAFQPGERYSWEGWYMIWLQGAYWTCWLIALTTVWRIRNRKASSAKT